MLFAAVAPPRVFAIFLHTSLCLLCSVVPYYSIMHNTRPRWTVTWRHIDQILYCIRCERTTRCSWQSLFLANNRPKCLSIDCRFFSHRLLRLDIDSASSFVIWNLQKSSEMIFLSILFYIPLAQWLHGWFAIFQTANDIAKKENKPISKPFTEESIR